MSSNYEKLKEELKELACNHCGSKGKVDDSAIGDIFYNEWDCPKCKGTGFKEATLYKLSKV